MGIRACASARAFRARMTGLRSGGGGSSRPAARIALDTARPIRSRFARRSMRSATSARSSRPSTRSKMPQAWRRAISIASRGSGTSSAKRIPMIRSSASRPAAPLTVGYRPALVTQRVRDRNPPVSRSRMRRSIRRLMASAWTLPTISDVAIRSIHCDACRVSSSSAIMASDGSRRSSPRGVASISSRRSMSESTRPSSARSISTAPARTQRRVRSGTGVKCPTCLSSRKTRTSSANLSPGSSFMPAKGGTNPACHSSNGRTSFGSTPGRILVGDGSIPTPF